MPNPKGRARRAAVSLAALGLTIGLAACQTALPPSTPLPTTGRATIAPDPYRQMCRRAPELCQATPGPVHMRRLTLDRQTHHLLVSVNRRVNHINLYERGSDLYGASDVWTVARGHGDCEDFAIAKLALLLDKGVPRAALRLAIAGRTRDRVRHAVLLVATDRGTYALDSSYDELKPWADLPYTNWRVEELSTGHWRRVQTP